jgi:putative Mg2+ transporter-C (MgtC) family protein
MTDKEMAVRLLVSLLFGALIGIERQWHHKNAGLKTNTLVAIGSTTFALISVHGLGPSNNPAVVAAGVVTGIGFIGGGVIMRRGRNVQGIDTAATLWAVSSMGISIGIGWYSLACFALVCTLSAQFLLRWCSTWIDRRSGLIVPYLSFHLAATFSAAAVDRVRAVWSSFARQSGVSITEYSETIDERSAEGKLEARFGLSERRVSEMTALGHQMSAIPGVTRAEWSESTITEPD